MCVSFFFFIFFSPFYFCFAVNSLYIFPRRGRGGGRRDGRWHFVARFLLAHHGTDSVHLFKQASKQTNKKVQRSKRAQFAACLETARGKGGEGLARMSHSCLSPSLAHTHTHTRTTTPLPPTGSLPPPKRCGAAALGCPHVAHPPLEDAR